MSAREKRIVWGTAGRKLLLLSNVVGLGLAGCSAPPPAGKEVVAPPAGQAITVAPPAPRPEVVGASPGAAFLWVPGYWAYREGRWHWVPGRWAVPPRPHALWAPGRWNNTPNGWVWTPGHWD
jgi:hypothetical protein